MTPKAFISYSWNSDEHQSWVVGLADALLENGIEVVLDKYDLREGHDAHAFMESMVTDPTVTKVILVCDEAYAKKADRRAGGVGTEAQIITPELYGKKDQNRFVAVIREKDGDGNACVPTYYKSRIYIDLSDDTTYAEEFERLVRWAFDKPLYRKPALGKPPAYLDEGEGSIKLGTSSRFNRAIDALKSDRANAEAVAWEYLETLADELEKFRLRKDTEHLDDEVVRNIDAFLPYRNEALSLFTTVAAYRDTPEMRRVVHQFFERLIPYMDRPPHVMQWNTADFDNFRFVIHELFLYAVAVLVKAERFEFAGHLINSDYYVPANQDHGKSALVPFRVFYNDVVSLQVRRQRLNISVVSLRPKMLNERCKATAVDFDRLMQADFILWLRSQLGGRDMWWWPDTLAFRTMSGGTFEVFARSQSSSYYDRVKILFGGASAATLRSVVEELQGNPNRLPRWDYWAIEPKALVGADLLATKP